MKNELLFFLKVLLLNVVTINSNVLTENLSKTINDFDSNVASSKGTELLQKLKNLQPINEQLNWSKDVRNAGQTLTRNVILQKLCELDDYESKRQAQNWGNKGLGNNRPLVKLAYAEGCEGDTEHRTVACLIVREDLSTGSTYKSPAD